MVVVMKWVSLSFELLRFEDQHAKYWWQDLIGMTNQLVRAYINAASQSN